MLRIIWILIVSEYSGYQHRNNIDIDLNINMYIHTILFINTRITRITMNTNMNNCTSKFNK
jgi:hypothetical protein